MQSEEAALFAAVCARPDDDLPRLVLADWLEESGRGPHAAFIRAQCDLAACPATHPDYPALVERQGESVAGVRAGRGLPVPDLPEGATFRGSIRGADGYGAYRRGFPWRAEFAGSGSRSHLFSVSNLLRGVERLAERTTIRHVELHAPSDAALAAVLGSRHFAPFTGLTLRPGLNEVAAAARRVAESPHAGNLANLELHGDCPAEGVAALAGAGFAGLTHFTAPDLPHLDRTRVESLFHAGWFAGLRSLSVPVGMARAFDALCDALAGRAELEALELRTLGRLSAAMAERLPPLPGLRRVTLQGGMLGSATAAALAALDWPAVGSVEITGGVAGRDALRLLGEAAWLAGVAELTLKGVAAEGPVAALAGTPLAASVRLLTAERSGLTVADLLALAAGAFPNLTTLDAPGAAQRHELADLREFGSRWSAPGLKSLTLDGWQFGSPGARRLAANPAFKGLRTLKLRRCGISDAGALALVRSPHLQSLVELDLAGNSLRGAACLELADPDVLPHLLLADLTGNRLKPDERARLKRVRPAVWA